MHPYPLATPIRPPLVAFQQANTRVRSPEMQKKAIFCGILRTICMTSGGYAVAGIVLRRW